MIATRHMIDQMPIASNNENYNVICVGEPVRAYGDFHHMPQTKSWALPRRVIAKAEHRPGQAQRCRFLATSDIDRICELIDARAPKSGRPKTYKKNNAN